MDDYIEITPHPIDIAAVAARLATAEIGAVATFIGVVRGNENGERIAYLEYEAYPEMAIQEMKRICIEIKRRWPTIERVAIVHRVGRVAVGETAVVVAVAAAHRSEVFAAVHHGINRLKKIVPIWKKEVGEKGAKWISEN